MRLHGWERWPCSPDRSTGLGPARCDVIGSRVSIHGRRNCRCHEESPPRVRLPQVVRRQSPAGTAGSLGLSQRALAHMAGLDRTYVGSVERAESNISIFDNIERLARALGLEPADLFKSKTGPRRPQGFAPLVTPAALFCRAGVGQPGKKCPCTGLPDRGLGDRDDLSDFNTSYRRRPILCRLRQFRLERPLFAD